MAFMSLDLNEDPGSCSESAAIFILSMLACQHYYAYLAQGTVPKWGLTEQLAWL